MTMCSGGVYAKSESGDAVVTELVKIREEAMKERRHRIKVAPGTLHQSPGGWGV